jgi:hypothetical protein
MKYTIEIDTSNDAFAEHLETEVAGILADEARRLRRWDASVDGSGIFNITLCDSNGLKVGRAHIEDTDDCSEPPDRDHPGEVTP